MKTFVTGATGLLGHNLVLQLRTRGDHVSGLARSPEKARRLLGDLDVQGLVGAVRDPGSFASALEDRDAVFHTAAYFREYSQPGDHRLALDEINVGATRALMRLADERGVGRFVHTSSSATIGREADGSASDEDRSNAMPA